MADWIELYNMLPLQMPAFHVSYISFGVYKASSMQASTLTRPIQSISSLQWPLAAENISLIALIFDVTWTSIELARSVLDNFLP